MPDDPLDALEMHRAFASMAELFASYLRELIAQGFTRHEALQIVIAWQTASQANTKPGESDA
jgi:hypothetical protein